MESSWLSTYRLFYLEPFLSYNLIYGFSEKTGIVADPLDMCLP